MKKNTEKLSIKQRHYRERVRCRQNSMCNPDPPPLPIKRLKNLQYATQNILIKRSNFWYSKKIH